MKQIFYLNQYQFVALCDLLKLAGAAESGGRAKHLIETGKVLCNDHIETRKTAKIRDGEVITYGDLIIQVRAGNEP